MASSLILTVTRECNLRCSYCPTAKSGWPSLGVADAIAAVDLFAEQYGGGDVKLFGGEPLLVPDVVRAAIAHARERPEIRRVYLSTNGLGLDESWLALLEQDDKLILTLSLDGQPEDHRKLRRALPQVPDAYDHVRAMLPAILRAPRVVVTQTIAPATAARAAENFEHLLSLGFRRFNFLPGYYLPWSDAQLAALERGFAQIAERITARWRRDERVYVRNLFTWAPTPFFNTGVVVDCDRRIHANNVGLSGALEELLDQTACGTLDEPPTLAALQAKAREVNGLLERSLAPKVWQSTLAVDAQLGRFCAGLYPELLALRKRRKAAA
jgi:sulfatase maturation enzyme AslB (radical SAM superfamily)